MCGWFSQMLLISNFKFLRDIWGYPLFANTTARATFLLHFIVWLCILLVAALNNKLTKSLFNLSSNVWASGSPKRTLYSNNLAPSFVNIMPKNNIPIYGIFSFFKRTIGSK